jgi:hypothetical protein
MEDAKVLSETLQEIRQIVSSSMRFFSLGGAGGVAAGLCGMAGAGVAAGILHMHGIRIDFSLLNNSSQTLTGIFTSRLFTVAACTFIAAFCVAFLFTWVKSGRIQTPVWGATGRRLMVHVAIPMCTGGLFLLKVAQEGSVELILPGSLLFYGLALMVASRFTFPESRYLAYGELILGLLCLWKPEFGLICWAAGFGILHIIYGMVTWRINPGTA